MYNIQTWHQYLALNLPTFIYLFFIYATYPHLFHCNILYTQSMSQKRQPLCALGDNLSHASGLYKGSGIDLQIRYPSVTIENSFLPVYLFALQTP